MLSELRQHSKSFFVYLLFAMIIVVFVFTFNMGGSSDGGCGSTETPTYAKVNGNLISQDTLFMGMALLPTYLQGTAGLALASAAGVDMKALFGGSPDELSPDQADAFLQLIEMIYIASDEAERMGFRIGDRELAKAMYPASFFKEKEVMGEDGLETTKKEFDETAYTNWVAYTLRASTQEYEAFVNRILLAFKLQEYVFGIIKTEPMELELAARAAQAKVDLQYVAIQPDMMATKAVPTEAEIQEALAKGDAELKPYYDAHPAEFHVAASYELHGIFVAALPPAPPAPKGAEATPPAKPTAEQKAAASAKAAEMLKRIQGQAPLLVADPAAPAAAPAAEPTDALERFKEVAKRESAHDESKERSGKLGLKNAVELGTVPFGADVVKALATAKNGDVVGPVVTDDGAWLLFVNTANAGKDLTYEQAKPEIAKALAQKKKAPEAAKALAESIQAKVKASNGKDFEAIVEEAKKGLVTGEEDSSFDWLKVEKTGKFSLGTSQYGIPGIGPFDELFQDAFKLSPENPVGAKVYEQKASAMMPGSGKVFVVVLSERELAPAAITEEALKTQKETVSAARSIPYFESLLQGLRDAAVAAGKVERTDDYRAFREALQAQAEERIRAQAAQGAPAAPAAAPAAAQ